MKVASNKGTYHIAYGPSATACSSSGLQRRAMYLRAITAQELATAPAATFCKRCFRTAERIEAARASAEVAA